MSEMIDSQELKKLVRAILKAASLASVNNKLDVNKTLGDSLKQENINPCFVKEATRAFNKRLTVLTFKKTADDHKADSFPLADEICVMREMGLETPQEKKASVQSVFSMLFVAYLEPMEKAASVVIDVTPNYLDRVDLLTFKQHIECMLDKHAAIFERKNGLYDSLDSRIKLEKQAFAKYFLQNPVVFDTLCNKYGEEFQDLMKDAMPNATFKKTASGAIIPQWPIYNKVASVLALAKELKQREALIAYYGKGLQEFAKTAADLGDRLQKYGLSKQSFILATPYVAMNALNAGAALAESSSDVLRNIAQTTAGAVGANIDNTREMLNAVGPANAGPGDVLDADFTSKDRFLDRLVAWSDVSADPQFAMYPSELVFNAVQKAMDTNQNLLRPDRRELLRASVAQLLAQNNRQNIADIASLGTALKLLNETGAGSTADAAMLNVDKEPTEGTPLPEYKIDTESVLSRDNSKNVLKLLGNMEKVTLALKNRLKATEEAAEKRVKSVSDFRKLYVNNQAAAHGKGSHVGFDRNGKPAIWSANAKAWIPLDLNKATTEADKLYSAINGAKV